MLRAIWESVSERPLGVLGLLLLFDGLLIGSYVLLWLTGWLEAVPNFDLGWQGSIQEHFTYLKWLACSLIGLCLFARSRECLYLAWAGLFLCLFVEDAESFREQAGALIANGLGLGPAAALTEQGLGEFAAAIIGSAGLLGAVAFVYWRTDDRGAKDFSRDLAPLLGGLIIFAIGVDSLHAMVGRLPTPDFALGVIEEGGEMIIASMLSAAFYMHAFSCDTPSDAVILTAIVDDPLKVRCFYE